jgi:hypothetical protein
MRIKRKISKVNDSAMDEPVAAIDTSAVAVTDAAAALPVAASAPDGSNAARGKAKAKGDRTASVPIAGSSEHVVADEEDDSSDEEATEFVNAVTSAIATATAAAAAAAGGDGNPMPRKAGRPKKIRPEEPADDGTKKRWTKRPEHWKEIAEYYKNSTLEDTLIQYADVFDGFSPQAQYHKLHSWKREMESGIEVKSAPPGREPAYGADVDLKLLDAVIRELQAGNPLEDAALRALLVDLLTEEGRAGLLVENGGSCVFQSSWAARFWKRHENEVKAMRVANVAAAKAMAAASSSSSSSAHAGAGRDGSGGNKERKAFSRSTAAAAAASMNPGAGGNSSSSARPTSGAAGSSSNGNSNGGLSLSMDAVVAEQEDNNKKKPWNRRPLHWMEMAEHFQQHGITATLAEYPEELGPLSYSAAYQKLNNWRNDVLSQRELHSPGRPPNYGDSLDLELFAQVQERMTTQQSVDDAQLREMLVDLLVAAGKDTLLRENGGDCTFGHSWAVRFRKRHNLPTRDQNGRKKKRGLDDSSVGGGGGANGLSAAAAAAVGAGGMQFAATDGSGSSAAAAMEMTEDDDDDSEDEARVEFTRNGATAAP